LSSEPADSFDGLGEHLGPLAEGESDDVPAGIDDPGALRRGKRRPHAHDAVPFDEDVGAAYRALLGDV